MEFAGYGYRRVKKELEIKGVSVGDKKVLNIMRQHNLLCRKKKRFKIQTTDSNHALRVYPNLLSNFVPIGVNEVWVSDITYVGLGSKDEFVYLATVLDMFSRKVVGWHLWIDLSEDLVVGALANALKSRNCIELYKRD